MGLIKKIYAILRNKYFYRKSGCKIGRFAFVHPDSTLHGKNLVGVWCDLKNTELGFASYVCEYSHMKDTVIGKYTCIGPNVRCALGTHPTKRFVAMHPCFFALTSPAGFSYVDRQKFQEYKSAESKKIHIGNDVWIGANVTIMDNVHIGDGAVVAAGAVVTGDVAPYTIVGGIPAKKIGDRFSEPEKEQLLRAAWWNRDESWIRQNAESFEDIDVFLEELQKRGELL